MRRSAVSVASHIAEGQGRLTDRDCVYLARRGSLCEFETQIELAEDLGFIQKRTG